MPVLPPVEFTYEATINEEIRNVDPESLENLPNGLDGTQYQWVDLDGEGLSGILTEQAQGWFYKRNLSPINFVETNKTKGVRRIEAKFAPVEQVATKPTLSLAAGHAQFLDLAGDGQLDLVSLSGSTPGFYERTSDEGWEAFTQFKSLPVLEWDDPNLKFVDLTGDGHADILISENEVFCWHPSLAEDGFGSAELVRKPFDEEKGPALVFADGTQSIYLADLSGDGLTDLVRIRNGEVCYWPNLGYGRFGAKVTMDNAPWFDAPDQFDQKRIRLADVDGSGITDIIYIHGDGVRIYFNQSGNSWSRPNTLPAFTRVDHLASIQALDLLGNGTACLVWSSPLTGEVRRPMRYIDLMGGQKPHLLVKIVNNLGAETHVQFAPSTKFYLADKLAGKPWITKLPFPVHCVEKVTVTDKWRQISFSSTYSYHHGYFDGPEREFRGFGRVEQLDIESYGEFAQGNSASPYITEDKTLYQPPVKTVTWYHTGALLERECILSQFEHEYFPRWLEEKYPGKVKILGDFQENVVPEPDLAAEDLSGEEWREALRACKGMMLRQEVYELDVDTLESGEHRPAKLFSTVYHNCCIRCLQPKAINPHSVFLVAESEALTYHYELDITEDKLPELRPDPRIAHTLNLKFDEYANVLQSVAVVYPRLGLFEDDAILADGLTDALSLIRRVQKEETHLAYSETRYTEDFGNKLADKSAALDNHRLRLPCEVLTYELTGIKPKSGLHFSLNELRAFQLSLMHQKSGKPVLDIPYHQIPNRTAPEKRLVEHARTVFFAESLVDPLPFREHGRLGLTYEAYKLALTEALLDAVFKDAAGNSKLDQTIDGATTARAKLNDPANSGYLSGAKLATRLASIPATELAGQYWIRSGIAGFAPDAAQHFYLPERYTDPFGNITTLEYDPLDLFVTSSTDALGSTTRVTRFDFRVLTPCEMQDINNNLSEVSFDVLGLPTALAVKGKGSEGDNLAGFDDALANPELAGLTAFFTSAAYDEVPARRWLGNATVRHVYYLGETRNSDGFITWGTHPSCACGIMRETHVSQLAPGAQSQLQTGFDYSDGMGTVLVKKVQAEPEASGKPLRWVANGKTILNNKGKPVKQYEPYFSSSGHRFEEPREEGVTPVIYYDAIGRIVRTEMPDGSFGKVEFSPWHVRTFDRNDTVKEPGNAWFARNTAATATAAEKRSAQLAAGHADTPALTILDSLGHEVISIAHNRLNNSAGGVKDGKYRTFTKLDAEGKPLWIRDARKNLVMQYVRQSVETPPRPISNTDEPANYTPAYDIAGNLLFQHSMDGGDRWMLNDAAAKPMLAWDSRGHTFHTDYDRLHRPLRSFVRGADQSDPNRDVCFNRIIYGEQHPEDTQRNLRGLRFMHLDQAGLIMSDRHDFKGNLLRGSRRLAQDYKQAVDWKVVEAALPADVTRKLILASVDAALSPSLETETFSSNTRYDALNRPIQLVAPHSGQPGAKRNVIQPVYNEAALLERLDVWLDHSTEPGGLLDAVMAPPSPVGVNNIDYNAKGQRLRIDHKNGATTRYTYDPQTFRLIHLYTRRGSAFTGDCGNEPPPPRFPAPDTPPTDTPCGLQNLHYTYDPVGNITHVHDNAQQTIYFRNRRVESSADYTYDAIYRLIKATGSEHLGQVGGRPNPPTPPDAFNNFHAHQDHPGDGNAMGTYVEEFLYDEVGNILSMRHRGSDPVQSGWKRCYQYANDSNRLLSTSNPKDVHNPDTACSTQYSATPVYGERYGYDDHGNIIGMPHLATHPAPQAANMHWSYKDELQQTDLGGGGTAYYVYDAAGQRTRKVWEKAPGTTEERIYLGCFEVFRRRNGAGTVTLERETLHIMDDKQRIALVETRTDTVVPEQLVRYEFGNHLGSANLELDHHAKIVSYEQYTPYGSTSYQAVRSQTETPKRYRYTGKERDEESGLYYHGARYYAPWLGTWISCDPQGLIDGINIYCFCHCNPILFSDKNGKQGTPMYSPMGQPLPLVDMNGGSSESSVPTASFSGPSSIRSKATSSESHPAKPTPNTPVKTATKEADVQQLKAYAYASTNTIGRWESGLGTAVAGAVLVGGSLVIIVGSGGTATPFVLMGATMALGAGVTGMTVGSFQLTQPISRDSARLSEVTQMTMDLGSSPGRLLGGTAGAVYTGDEAGLRSGINIGAKLDLAINFGSALSGATRNITKTAADSQGFEVSHDAEFYARGAVNAEKLESTLSGQGVYQLIGDHPPDQLGQTVVRVGEGAILDRFAARAHGPDQRLWRGLQVIAKDESLSQRLSLEADIGLSQDLMLSGEASSLYKLPGNPALGQFAGASYNVPKFTLLNPSLYPSARKR